MYFYLLILHVVNLSKIRWKMAFFKKGNKETAVLIDPDKTDVDKVDFLLEKADRFEPSYYLVGGSFVSTDHLDALVVEIKKQTGLPVILFPGDHAQISRHADAILFLSLLSGRNPEYLIGQQVKAAPLIKKAGLKTVSTGYILIGGRGPLTTVQYITQSLPIPAEKPDLALATAWAGEMLGMECIYMDAGSGAQERIPPEVIRHVSRNLSVPLIVGGGIRSIHERDEAFESGADVVVLGTVIEENL